MLSSFMQLRMSRLLHTGCIVRAVDKSLLAKLRKKTGYSIANCRKALDKHENNIDLAEKWLKSQAQTEGWAKVASLAERATSQGLLGVHVEGNQGSIVEVNCETDFVARNNSFVSFTQDVAKTCLVNTPVTTDIPVSKNYLKEDDIKKLTNGDGKTLADVLALTVGAIKENMKLRRAVKVACGEGIDLVGLTHPQSSTQTGKYAALLALKNPNNNLDIARKLCLHVIGMNPTAIGTDEDMKVALTEAVNNDEEENTEAPSDQEESSIEVEKEDQKKGIMMYQEFIDDENINVAQILKEHNIQIIDFVRLNCGEQTD